MQTVTAYELISYNSSCEPEEYRTRQPNFQILISIYSPFIDILCTALVGITLHAMPPLARRTHPLTILQPQTCTNSYFSHSHAVAVWNSLPYSIVSSNNISVFKVYLYNLGTLYY